MHWTTVLFSGFSLWLSLVGSVEAFTILDRRRPNPDNGFVYRADGRSPQEIRNSGGFQPQGPDWHNYEDALSINRHYDAGPNGCGLDDSDTPGFVFRTAYVSVARTTATALRYGSWIYEIRATPNMLGADGFAEDEVFALGGVQWRQIRRFAPVRDPGSDGRVEESAWVNNADYDLELYERSRNAADCRITEEDDTRFPRALIGGTDPYSDSDSDDESNEVDGYDRRRQAAIGFFDDLAMFALVGDFPPVFAQPAPRTDVPGAEGNAIHVDRVAQELQRLRVTTPEQTDVQQLLAEADRENCNPKPGPVRAWRRRDVLTRADAAPSNFKCCRILKKIKREIRKKQAAPDSPPNGDKTTAKPKPQGPVTTVFYGSFLWPEEAKKQGGFLPPSITPPGPTYDVPGAPGEPDVISTDFATYVMPTFQSLGAAARHASQLASRETGDFEGVVYAVHATPNMVSAGNESAAVGGILWTQVMGWMQVPRAYALPAEDEKPQEKGQLKEKFTKAFTEKKDLFTPNKDYDHKFDQLAATAQVPDKMDTPQDLSGFMNKNGQAVGWKGRFPLIEAARAIDGDASKAAKTNKAVAAPHEPGVFEKIGDFVKAHPVAVALIPVVVVANLIPGLGEVADAGEVAALTADGAEALELSDVGGSALASAGKGMAQVLKSAAKLKVA